MPPPSAKNSTQHQAPRSLAHWLKIAASIAKVLPVVLPWLAPVIMDRVLGPWIAAALITLGAGWAIVAKRPSVILGVPAQRRFSLRQRVAFAVYAVLAISFAALAPIVKNTMEPPPTIEVMEFSAKDESKYRMGDLLWERLSDITRQWPEITVKRSSVTVGIDESAESVLNRSRASVVVTGWYAATSAAVQTHLRVIARSPWAFARPDRRVPLTGRVADLEDFTFHARVGAEAEAVALAAVAVALDRQSGLDAASAALNRAIDLAPVDRETVATLRLMRGTLRLTAGDPRGALDDLEVAAEAVPDSVDVLANRGLARERLGDVEGASADYQRALALRPGSTVIAFNLANALSTLGRLPEALQLYSSAMSDPSVALEAHVGRGNVLQMLGRDEEAVADFSQALADPALKWIALNNRANALANLGRFAEAIGDLTAAASIRVVPDAQVTKASYLYRLGRRDEALAVLAGVLAANPQNSSALALRGQIFSSMGLIEKALGDFDLAIALDPSAHIAWANRGLVKFRQGWLGEAEADTKMAVSLWPSLAPAHLNLALIQEAQGKYSEAEDTLRALSALSPVRESRFDVARRVSKQESDADWEEIRRRAAEVSARLERRPSL